MRCSIALPATSQPGLSCRKLNYFPVLRTRSKSMWNEHAAISVNVAGNTHWMSAAARIFRLSVRPALPCFESISPKVSQRRGTRFQFLPFAVSLTVIVADRLSKQSIQHSITGIDSISVFPGWLRIIHTENPGGAFGLLAEGNAFLRTSVLVGVAALVLVFVVRALWGVNTSFNGPVTRFGLSLILGGAIGNLYDRVVHGTVTDFIEVYHRSWSFPAFNVADSAITVGAILLMIDFLWPRSRVE